VEREREIGEGKIDLAPFSSGIKHNNNRPQQRIIAAHNDRDGRKKTTVEGCIQTTNFEWQSKGLDRMMA